MLHCNLQAFVFVSTLSAVWAGLQSFDELYADGIEAYWNGNWEGCINSLENSLSNYRTMRVMLKNCSMMCSNSSSQDTAYVSPGIMYMINRASCLKKCEKKNMGQCGVYSRISTEVVDDFNNKQPYVYLQYAYFRAGEFAKSLSSTFTYAQYNPEDEMMNKNMEYFRSHQNTTQDMFVDRETHPHISAYGLAVEAYNGEDYVLAVERFEEALQGFYGAEIECRAMCEAEHDGADEYLPQTTSFYRQIIDHYSKVLECYMRCPNEVARVSINTFIHNYLPSLYEYLHYAYYELKDHANAVRCLMSHLLFFPDNQLFHDRKELFKQIDDVSAREDALSFSKRLKLQVSLLKFIYQNFGIHDYNIDLFEVYKSEAKKASEDVETDSEVDETQADQRYHYDESHRYPHQDNGDGYSSLEEKQLDIIASKDEYNEQMQELKKKVDQLDDTDMSHLLDTPIGRQTVDSKNLIEIVDRSSVESIPTAEGPILFNSVLLANSTQMAGPFRFTLDSFSTNDDCQQLIDLELTGGLLGDGYRGKTSPHTERERFQGITVYRAAQLAQRGEVPGKVALLYYELSERVRQQVQAYFKLYRLYFDYTHLVCRTALREDDDESRENSHPIHGDNCILEENGTCLKRSPAYTWRDYSAILYLNNDFDGGHFVMTDHTARRVRVQVKPQCGRLVGFSAGKDCLHGVKPVTRGRRCAMALWFTLDADYDEKLRKKAKEILDTLLAKDEL